MTQYIKVIKKIIPSFIFNFLKKIFHILRFYNLINPDYSVDESIKFGEKKAGQFLKNKIVQSKNYLEFGSGNTTILAFNNSIKYNSVESDRGFYLYMKKKNIQNIFFYSLGYVAFYSYPLFNSKLFKNFYAKRAKIYSSRIFDKLKNELIFPDLILVDGRYRVLCMLNIFLYAKSNGLVNTCVILDDFKDRDYYYVIKKFFNVELIGRLGVCFLNDAATDDEAHSLIDKYSTDPR